MLVVFCLLLLVLWLLLCKEREKKGKGSSRESVEGWESKSAGIF